MTHLIATGIFQISIVAQRALQSGARIKPKHMTEEQQIAIGANCVLIVLTSIFIFITVFYLKIYSYVTINRYR